MNVVSLSTNKVTIFFTINLSSDEVDSALANYPDLSAATRAGLFSPATATAEDVVAIDFRLDGTVVIVVVAVRTTISDSGNSNS